MGVIVGVKDTVGVDVPEREIVGERLPLLEYVDVNVGVTVTVGEREVVTEVDAVVVADGVTVEDELPLREMVGVAVVVTVMVGCEGVADVEAVLVNDAVVVPVDDGHIVLEVDRVYDHDTVDEADEGWLVCAFAIAMHNVEIRRARARKGSRRLRV